MKTKVRQFVVSAGINAIQTDYTLIFTTGEMQLNLTICYDSGGNAGISSTFVSIDNSRIETDTRIFRRSANTDSSYLGTALTTEAMKSVAKWTKRWVVGLTSDELNYIQIRVEAFCNVPTSLEFDATGAESRL